MNKLEQAARQIIVDWDSGIHLHESITALREALAEPQITTPDVCGEVCARAKLCYGCGKALDEANAEHERKYAAPQPVNKLKEIEMTTNNEQNLDLEYKAQMFEALLQAGVEQLPVFKTALALFNCEEPFDFEQVERDPVTKRLQQQVDYWINHYDRKSPADMELLQKDVAKFAEDAFASSGKPIAEQEPVCCDKCGSKLGTTVVPCDCIAPMQQAEQKPMAIDWEPMQNFWRNNSSIDWGELESAVKCAVTTPVRTKDLTDDEIDRIACNVSHKEFARAVIAAYKEKNK